MAERRMILIFVMRMIVMWRPRVRRPARCVRGTWRRRGWRAESPAEVARLLAAWQGGIVAELMTRFGCPEVVRSLTGAVARLLGINTFFVNTDLWHRFWKLFLRTVELVQQGRAEPAEPWR